MSFEGRIRDTIERREGQRIEDPRSRKPVVVLTTSDIQDIKTKPIEGREPNGVNHRGSETSYAYTRGVLERVLGLDFQVYVVSTRTKLYSTDDWWVALVGEDHIFFASDRVVEEHVGVPQQMGETGNKFDDRMLVPYRRLFEALGVPFTWTGFHRDLLHHLPEFGIETPFSLGIQGDRI